MPIDTPLNETILETDLPIVDPHHHLWDYPPAFISTLPEPTHGLDYVVRRVPRYLFHDLLADLNSGHNVRATVYMECGSMYNADAQPAFRPVGETEFVAGVAAMSASGFYGDVRACAAIVGHVDLTEGEVVARAVLEAHIAAGGGRFRGIRHIATTDDDRAVLGRLPQLPPGLYGTPAFRAGYAALGELGLSFDAWMLEPQLPDLIGLARAFPDIPVILDHVGTPLGIGVYAGRLEERFPIWRRNISELARSSNVTVKLGGLAMPFLGSASFMSDPPTPSAGLAAEWKPYVEAVIEAFGVERCMFESNFPVDLGTCAYDVLWNAFKRIAAGYSEAEKTALFSGTASRVYRVSV